MIIVFTAEQRIYQEDKIINHLFEEGLEVLHLRKPNYSFSECKHLINAIAPEFHNRIMVHQHHGLTELFDLKGVHFKEVFRKHLSFSMPNYIEFMQENGFEVSTGFHCIYELIEKEELFDYTFLSPIFNSISKMGYKSKAFDFKNLEKAQKRIIALGGINKFNISEIFEKGFDGAAVLGAIWKNDNPIKAYNELRSANNNLCALNNTAI